MKRRALIGGLLAAIALSVTTALIAVHARKPVETSEIDAGDANAAPTELDATQAGAVVESGTTTTSLGCGALTPLLEMDSGALPVLFPGEDTFRHLDATDLFGKCFATKGGAWAARLVRFQNAGDALDCDPPHRIHWELLHIDANGSIARLAQSYAWSVCAPTIFAMPQVSDLDGDGVEELVVPSEQRAGGAPDEDPFIEAGAIWTFKNGEITAYSALRGATFFDANDDDGDGRVDLLTHAPFTLNVSGSCTGMERRVTGPALLRHTLADGTFSVSDDVAIQFARRACAKPPATLVLEPDGGPGAIDSSYERYACALLWNRDARSLGARLTDECAKSRTLVAIGSDAGLLSNCDYAHETILCDEDSAAPWRSGVRPPFKLANP